MGLALVWGASHNLGFPFNIFATAEASDFKFGMHLGFAKAHRRITPTRKSEHSRRLG